MARSLLEGNIGFELELKHDEDTTSRAAAGLAWSFVS